MPVDQLWNLLRPLNRITGRRSYFYIPAFTYNTTWLGASEVITQFNYTAERNFVIPRRVRTPEQVNFCPCIRWHDGENNVQRYKLWENVGEVLNVPLIGPGNKIGANFTIEIYNIETAATVSLEDSIQIYTGLLKTITEFHTVSDVEESVSTEVPRSELLNINANSLVYSSPIDIGTAFGVDIQAWYDANYGCFDPFGVADKWLDRTVHARHLVQAVGANRPEPSGSFGEKFAHAGLIFSSEKYCETGAIAVNYPETIYIVMKIHAQDLVNFFTCGAGRAWEGKFNATPGKLDIKKYATTNITINPVYQAPSVPFLLILANGNRSASLDYSVIATTGLYVDEFNRAINNSADRTGELGASLFSLGDISVHGAEYEIAEVIITGQPYNGDKQPTDFNKAIQRYLANTYQGLMEVPLQFSQSATHEPTT